MKKIKTALLVLILSLFFGWCTIKLTGKKTSKNPQPVSTPLNEIVVQPGGTSSFTLQNFLPPIRLEEDLCHCFLSVDLPSVKFVCGDCDFQETSVTPGSYIKVILADGEEEKLYLEEYSSGSVLKLWELELYHSYRDTQNCEPGCALDSICVDGVCQEEVWQYIAGWSVHDSIQWQCYTNSSSPSFMTSSLKYQTREICENSLKSDMDQCNIRERNQADYNAIWGYCTNLLKPEGWCEDNTEICETSGSNTTITSTGDAWDYTEYCPEYSFEKEEEGIDFEINLDEDYEKIEIVFDASGSMSWQIEGERKIDIAKNSTNNFIDSLASDPDAQLGVLYYADCTDIQQGYPIQLLDVDLAKQTVANLEPTSMTPIADALEMAAAQLYPEGVSQDEKNAIVLISDGRETCDRDPTAVIDDLKASGYNVVVHVVGLDVDESTAAELRSIAESGGWNYTGVSSSECKFF